MNKIIFAASLSFAFAIPALAKSRPMAQPSYSSSRQDVSEIQIGSLGNGGFSSTKVGTSTISTFALQGSYSRIIQDDIQIGAEVGFSSTSGGTKSTSAVNLAAFGNYNFDSDLKNAFYAKGGLGTFSVTNSSGDLESKFGFFAGAGKRMPLLDNAIVWNPEFRLFKKGDLDPSFEILLINVSVMF
jgi:hypothetical protein